MQHATVFTAWHLLQGERPNLFHLAEAMGLAKA
jgi:hypothetical protein